MNELEIAKQILLLDYDDKFFLSYKESHLDSFSEDSLKERRVNLENTVLSLSLYCFIKQIYDPQEFISVPKRFIKRSDDWVYIPKDPFEFVDFVALYEFIEGRIL